VSDRTILVAGIGNIFLGDDGFGVEVAQRLAGRSLPNGVRVVDYGIRGFDLAYALLDGPDATILIDAMPRGEAPGTIFVLEPDLEAVSWGTDEPGHPQGSFQGHAMTPDSVFALVRTLGGTPRNILVVGCEPETFGPEEEGQLGLSATVAAVVPEAITTVERLLAQVTAAGSVA